MASHYHIISAFKSRGNATVFKLVKRVNGVIKPFSLDHAGVSRVVVSVLGTSNPEILIDSDVGDDVVFNHSELSVKFGSLDVPAGSYDVEIIAYKTGVGVPITIIGNGLKESIQIQMRD